MDEIPSFSKQGGRVPDWWKAEAWDWDDEQEWGEACGKAWDDGQEQGEAWDDGQEQGEAWDDGQEGDTGSVDDWGDGRIK